MDPDQLYDYITQHMTPEEALRKMLKSSLISYEQLKFQDGEEVHPLMIITFAAWDMGWQLAIEKQEKEVRGITIGTAEYMEKHLK